MQFQFTMNWLVLDQPSFLENGPVLTQQIWLIFEQIGVSLTIKMSVMANFCPGRSQKYKNIFSFYKIFKSRKLLGNP